MIIIINSRKSLSTVISDIFLFTARPTIPPHIPPITIKIKSNIEKSGTLFVKIEEIKLAI